MTTPGPMTPAEIRGVRAAHGWTVAELADACGVAKRTAENWLSGANVPRGSALVLLRRHEAAAGRPAAP